MEELKERMEALKEDPAPSIRKFQDAQTEMTKVKAKAEKDHDNNYASMLVADIEKIDKKLVKVVSLLKKMLENKASDEGLPPCCLPWTISAKRSRTSASGRRRSAARLPQPARYRSESAYISLFATGVASSGAPIS